MRQTGSSEAKKLIVISGVNLFSGGTLTILRQCLAYLDSSPHITASYEVKALVHKTELFPPYSHIQLTAYPKPRGSWLHKLYYEYYFFKKISLQQKVFLWFSLYDMTPSVKAERRAVYCHNPSPFYKTNSRERRFDKGFTMFTLFYQYLYRINIKQNNFVVVQQDWIRQRFTKMFRLPPHKIIVAHPEATTKQAARAMESKAKSAIFIYPALPRVFKNCEVILEAAALLQQQTTKPFSIWLTLDGTENKYAAYIKEMAINIPSVELIGLQQADAMKQRYETASCLLFPSKLETWGLPITEAKSHGLPMLVADLPYAKETVGDYEQVSFFNPTDAALLSRLMLQFIKGGLSFDGNKSAKPAAPFSESWQQTFALLLQ